VFTARYALSPYTYTAYYVSSLKGYSGCSVAARERERVVNKTEQISTVL